MLGFITSKIGVYVLAGLLLGGMVIGFATHFHAQGVRAEQQRALARSVDVLRERSRINGRTSSASDAELCVSLGGRWVFRGGENSCE